MADHAAQGKKLLAESKYTEAVEQLTQALKTSPTSPDYLVQRSTAYQRAKQYVNALHDAEAAVVYAQKRAKRELIVQAQLRRGIALFNLEQYGNAKFVLDIVKRMDPKEKSVDIWISKSLAKLAALGGDDEKSTVTAVEIPAVDAIEKDTLPVTTNSTASVAAPSITSTSTTTQTPADKIRHDWYQTTSTVYFSLLAKGVPQDKANIEITAASLSIAFPNETTGSTYDYTIDPFFAHVDPSKSSFRILPSKIEITLSKAVSGQKWSALEGTEPLVQDNNGTETDTAASKQTLANKVSAQPPSYPTSSRTGPKDWDKIASENETKRSDGIDDDETGDVATKFFKQLYKGASAETQRAMMKSYIESNGTALSTDWTEVSKNKVETLPPDGMEAKRW